MAGNEDREDELSLDDAIGAALDEQLEPAELSEEQKRQYARDEQGRFAAKQEQEAREAAEQAAPADQQGDKPPAALKAWSPLWLKQEHGVEWDKLPEPFRKALEQREREAAQGIEKHATSAKAWDPVNQEIAPYAAELQAQGVSPQQYVTNLINADKYLRSDPVAAVNWLVQSYLGTDVFGLAQWMYDQGQRQQQADPVQQELQTLKQQLQELREAPVRQQRESINSTVSEWSKDKPYYEELKAKMFGLIQADPSVREQFNRNPTATLDSLYEQASWAHPQIRERILADQRKAEVKRARDNSYGTRDAGAHQNGAARGAPKMSLEEELGTLLDGAL